MKRILVVALGALLLFSGGVSSKVNLEVWITESWGTFPRLDETKDGGKLIRELLVWIESRAGYYKIPDALPTVYVVPKEIIMRNHYRLDEKTLEDLKYTVPPETIERFKTDFSRQYKRPLRAITSWTTGIIYIDSQLNMADSLGKATLLHELIHWLQKENNNMPKCLRKNEKEAYLLENQWRREHGLPPAIDEDIELEQASRCPDFTRT